MSIFNWIGICLFVEIIENVKYFCDLVCEEVMLLNFSLLVVGVGSVICGLGVREDLLVKVEFVIFEFLLEKI